MQKSKIKFHYFLPILIALSIGVYQAISAIRSTNAQTSAATCSGLYVSLDGTATTNTTAPLSSLHQLGIINPSSLSIRNVVFTLDNVPMGRASTSGGSGWNMPWYTQAAPNGGHQAGATIQLDTLTCNTPPMTVMLSNYAVAPFVAAVSPGTFSGLANDAINFGLNAKLNPNTVNTTAIDVTNYTVFQKSPPSLGTITPLDYSSTFRYAAGTVAGSSAINIAAFYGGASRPLSIPITIYPQTTSTSTTSTQSGTTGGQTATTTQSGTTALTAPPPASAPAASIEADPVVKSCTVTALTAARYLEISTGRSRPTAAEFEEINQCFSSRNFVLPTGFVPVAPDKVGTLPKSSAVKIAGAINATKKKESSEITTLKFSGKAKPDSTVLLYVHSEPLVLSTQADKNGDWNYALEDPLEAGKHEVYAVVNKGDGSYERSSVFDFVIAKASASPINPKGYSLKIEAIKPTASENSRPKVIYISASVGLIIFVLVILFVSLRVYKKHHAAPQPLPVEPTPSAPAPAAPADSHLIEVPPVQPAPTPTTPPAPSAEPPSTPGNLPPTPQQHEDEV